MNPAEHISEDFISNLRLADIDFHEIAIRFLGFTWFYLISIQFPTSLNGPF